MGMEQKDGQWLWSCSCGKAGEPTSREAAREAFKQHRRTCGMGSQTEGQSIMSTTAKKNVVAKAPKAAPKGTPKTDADVKAAAARKRKDQSVTEAQAKAAYARLKKKDGSTTLIKESKTLGFSHNGPLRKALRDLIGNAEYDKLMEGSRPKGGDKKPAPAAKKEAAAPAKKAEAKKPAAKKPAAKKAAVVEEGKAEADEKHAKAEVAEVGA